MKASAILTLAILGATGCGSTSSNNGIGPGDAGAGGDAAALFGDAAPTTTGTDDCSEAAKLVYVVSSAYDLYSFYPATRTFKKVGHLACPDPGQDVAIGGKTATPNSMAVDRQGYAWVSYTSGKLFKVSTADASCQSTTFVPGQSGVFKFGMAFSTNGGAGTKSESLYVVGIRDTAGGVVGQGLSTIDLSTMKLRTIGDFSGNLAQRGAELTGTGDGKLWGFFTTSPATLAAIDKATGATSSVQPLTGVETGTAWAFSFWGGDFWFYTAPENQPSSVTQLKTSGGGTLGVAVPNVGFRIVGAGVSTCAPLVPPK